MGPTPNGKSLKLFRFFLGTFSYDLPAFLEVLSFNIWAGGAGEIWRRSSPGHSNQQRLVGTQSKQQHGGGRHHLNLPHQWMRTS